MLRTLLAGAMPTLASDETSAPATFDSPAQAVARLGELLGSDRVPEEVLGPGSRDLLSSGDEQAEREDALRVKAWIEEDVFLQEYGPDTVIAFLGHEDWPLPFPIVQREGRWSFDTEGGRRELLNRRIGRNELLALETLHAIVDAQREYRALAIGGRPSYARKFMSAADTRDGLYWPTAVNETESPLGPFLAEASVEIGEPAAERKPFRGYYFRMLTAQGTEAPGGARTYLDSDASMTRGFAVIAWPAKYESSGVMTFLVAEGGIVFQRDLGPDTERIVRGIDAYAPDASWEPTED